jgi:hypothetical protein
MEITQALTPPPAYPDRTDRINFSEEVAAYLSWWATHNTEIGAWTSQANNFFTTFAVFIAGLSQQEPIFGYLSGTTYAFPTCVAGSDGCTYRYINSTPSSGHDPVADTAGTYWYNLTAYVKSSGQVLQSVYASSSASVSTTATTWQTKATPAPAIITKQANAKIRVRVGLLVSPGANTNAYVGIRREVAGGTATDNIGGKINGFLHSDTSGSTQYQVFYEYTDTVSAAAGTTITYKINYRAGAAVLCYFGNTTALETITLEEILL